MNKLILLLIVVLSVVVAIEKSPWKKMDNGIICEMCQGAVETVDEMLTKNSTDYEIESQLEEWCEDLRGRVGAICEALVIQNLPTIIEYLAQDLNSLQVCTEIELC
eukprot:TRINITY_DN8902_c0_g1_i1.p1 TRINITY_DN8902_c0_g1~~TRINITY_DN8902_c0_g1_i1.p1  ORF type:complete len:120 (+),score=32.03 TRINITY_DN8902_c0_g1_i1:45-362(+)